MTDADYESAPVQERALAWASSFKGTREHGINRGPLVQRFLASVGLGPGYPWCAAFMSHVLRQAGYVGGPTKGRAAVRNWAKWAKDENKVYLKPKRGDLFYWLNKNGTGHIGIVAEVNGGTVRTYEGNTNAQGSREGDGVYEKSRQTSGLRFIRWWS